MYPKCHFGFLINWKRKFKIYGKILFLLQYEKGNSNNWLLFSCLIDLYFELVMLSIIFHFHKKWKTKYSLTCFRFSLNNNWYFKKIKINLMVIFTSVVYMLLKSKFGSSLLRFFAVQCCSDTKNLVFRKQLMYLMFLLLTATFILEETAIVRKSPKVIPKSQS